jgi:hypothetical protein
MIPFFTPGLAFLLPARKRLSIGADGKKINLDAKNFGPAVDVRTF